MKTGSQGTGPPVLLIQGVGIAGCGWRPQVDGLSDAFELAWYDNPGIGDSPGPVGDLNRMVDAALEVMDWMSWDDAHVVGHSLGGVIAQRLALDHPDRVRSLALLCTFALGRSTLSLWPSDLWLQLRTALGTAEMRRWAFYALVSNEEPTLERIEALEQVFGRKLHELPSAVPAQVWALIRADQRAELPSLTMPTMVLGGTHDHPAPIGQSRLLAELLQTELIELDAGHALTIEHAEVVNTHLREFWGTVPGA